MVYCPITGKPATPAELAEVRWLAPKVLRHIQQRYPNWTPDQGACPALVQQILLEILLAEGESAFHQSVQTQFPLDAEAAFGAVPTPLRLHADVRYTGKGVTLAMIDADFYPHPDLIYPQNRIRAVVDVTVEPPTVYRFAATTIPDWAGATEGRPLQWHGTMTAAVAAGNGWQSRGLYRGLAHDAELVLIKTYHADSGIGNAAILRALEWVHTNAALYNIKVVNMSIGGEADTAYANHPIDTAIQALIAAGVVVVAAAGNDGIRQLFPPASSPAAITVGGIDDKNDFDDDTRQLWHSNYGESTSGGFKPELVAPSIWVVAPVLPHTDIANEALALFEQRGDPDVEARIDDLKLITPYYQHVDGTSFAAPLVASTVACMLQANPQLSPGLLRDLLIQTAEAIPDVSRHRQGYGVLQAGLAVAMAIAEAHTIKPFASPIVDQHGIRFMFHDHHAQSVAVYGSWDNWQAPLLATRTEHGVWVAELHAIPPQSVQYKFLVNDTLWLDDPLNPQKIHDTYGGFNSLITINQFVTSQGDKS